MVTATQEPGTGNIDTKADDRDLRHHREPRVRGNQFAKGSAPVVVGQRLLTMSHVAGLHAVQCRAVE